MTTDTYALTRTDTIGATLSAAAGFLSLACVSVMFVIMFWNVYREIRKHPKTWRLIREPIDLYMLLLFLGDLIQAIAHVLSIKWVHTGIVEEGIYCTAQGGLKQFGETGAAMTTLVIAIYSFVVVWWSRWWRAKHSLFVAKIVMAIVWLYVFLFVVAGIVAYAKKDYITPDPYWCWIRPHYTVEQIMGEYLWFWLTLFFSFLTYIPLYLCSRGNIIVSNEAWWKFKYRRVREAAPGHYRAMGLLAYPLVYSVLVLPLSVIRWKGFSKHDSNPFPTAKEFPPAENFAALILFELSGVFNVLLLLTTRPDVLLFGNNNNNNDNDNDNNSSTKGKTGMVLHDMTQITTTTTGKRRQC